MGTNHFMKADDSGPGALPLEVKFAAGIHDDSQDDGQITGDESSRIPMTGDLKSSSSSSYSISFNMIKTF
jgi:hypothetical protein